MQPKMWACAYNRQCVKSNHLNDILQSYKVIKTKCYKMQTKKNCVLNFKYWSAYQGISLVIEENINSEWLLIL